MKTSNSVCKSKAESILKLGIITLIMTATTTVLAAGATQNNSDEWRCEDHVGKSDDDTEQMWCIDDHGYNYPCGTCGSLSEGDGSSKFSNRFKAFGHSKPKAFQEQLEKSLEQ